jgi:enamine deaminase RidA (YjgF/YER057c/UK114 family)
MGPAIGRGTCVDQNAERQHGRASTSFARQGGTREDVVDVGVLLANLADFAAFNEEYARFFPNDKPARYVAKLGVDIPYIPVSTRMTADTD